MNDGAPRIGTARRRAVQGRFERRGQQLIAGLVRAWAACWRHRLTAQLPYNFLPNAWVLTRSLDIDDIKR